LIRRRRRRRHWGANTGTEREGIAVALKQDGVVRPDGTLTRKEAANLLGMNDTEFGLRLIWDSAFPKQIQGGFRAADIRAWVKTQRRHAAMK
jgi:predicted DNA-binding transcriptional regulator AlpA